ncbi:MAG: class I SAM-dependent methyltransferase [Dehalococcoidia bacterium]
MLTRDDIYTLGLPADIPHEPLIDFAMKHAGKSVVDIGCGSGTYAERLQQLGKSVVGLEADGDSIQEATARGLEVTHGDATSLPFEDNQFDSALLFEVLEHIPNFTAVVREALRVTRRNVLVTVPNVGEYEHLMRYGITYWHLVTIDHVNFFELDDLVELAERCHARADAHRAEPLVPAALLRPRRPLWFAVSALRRLGLVRPIAYRRLYAVIEPVR